VFVFAAFFILVSVSVGFAMIKGGPSERAGAIVTLLGVTISPIVAHSHAELWHGSENGILLVDTGALVCYAAIMLRSTRFWPIWTTAFQLVTVAAHVGPIFRHSRVAVPFAFEEEIWSWVIFVQLIIVTWLDRRIGRRGSVQP
jgi:hypothetical protein